MNTKIVYFDETGDDGSNTKSSNAFILTSIYMSADKWQENYDKIKDFRKKIKEDYGFPVPLEMHTKPFLTNKKPYWSYHWTTEQKQEIIKRFTIMIASLDISVVNVIIDKTKIETQKYNVLEKALTYNIQRIENDSAGNGNFIIITDQGRVTPMRKTARRIRAFNPIPRYGGYVNKPIKNMIEDILEKNSKESYFIQVCDFISYFVHLHYSYVLKNKALPKRVSNLIDYHFINGVIKSLDIIFNHKASTDPHGYVIYPK